MCMRESTRGRIEGEDWKCVILKDLVLNERENKQCNTCIV